MSYPNESTSLEAALGDLLGPVKPSRGRPKLPNGEAARRAEEREGRSHSDTVSVIKMRAAHHRLAQLCSMGYADAEIARQTGYQLTYVSTLRTMNPAFKELIAHYGLEEELRLASVRERQLQVGTLALEELADRLSDEEQVSVLTTRELLEVHDSMITKPVAAERGGIGPVGGAGTPPVLIQFVGAQAPGMTIEHGAHEVRKQDHEGTDK